MSDVNLKRDVFFQKEMAKNDGWVPVETLLKCNKLKKLTDDAAVVVEALAASEQLTIGEDKSKIKRNTAAPPLDADVAKRAQQRDNKSAKSDANVGGEEAMKAAIDEKAEEAVQKRHVFKVAGVPEGVKWTEIKDAVKEATGIESKFFIQMTEGSSDARLSCLTEGDAEKFKGAELKVKEATLELTKIEDKAELKEYWINEFTKNPPKEIEKMARKKQHQKPAAGKNKRKGAEKSGPLTVAGVEYPSKDEVKAKAMEIVKRNPDQAFQVLEGAEKDFAAAILAFHPKAAEKKKSLKEYGVGTNPEHPTTRCFFAVQEDGTKVDFSYIKCIDAAPAEAAAEGASPSAKKAKTEA